MPGGRGKHYLFCDQAWSNLKILDLRYVNLVARFRVWERHYSKKDRSHACHHLPPEPSSSQNHHFSPHFVLSSPLHTNLSELVTGLSLILWAFHGLAHPSTGHLPCCHASTLSIHDRPSLSSCSSCGKYIIDFTHELLVMPSSVANICWCKQ